MGGTLSNTTTCFNLTHLLVVAGDTAEVAVKLVRALGNTIFSFLLAVLGNQWTLFDL